MKIQTTNISKIFGIPYAKIFVFSTFLALATLYSLTSVFLHTSPKAYAATSSTLNFQGRLYTSSGSVVPDGYYNIQFKLYDGGTSGGPGGTGQANAGTNLWTESYYDSNGVTAGNDNRLRVVNGYFSANLGSQTAFPGTINWDQELWLTMNVGGTTQTATPTYDGEMLQTGNTRTKLTGVPYAFRAGSAAGVTSNNTNAASTDSDSVSISTGNAAGATSNSGNLTIDTGTATGTAGTISLGTTNSSGVTIGSGTNTFSLQTSNIDISSAGAISGATGLSLASGNFLQSGTGTFTTGSGTVSLNGAITAASTADFTGSIATKKGTDYSTTGTSNNVNFGDVSLVRLTGASAQTITGIAGGRDGEVLILVNAGSNTATISNASGSSSASNQIITGTGSDLSLAAGASIGLIYDSGASFWRVVGGVAGGGGSCASCANQALSNLASVNINAALNATSANLTLQTTTSGNIVLDTAAGGTINLNDAVTTTGAITFSGIATDITTGSGEDLTVVANGAGIISLNDTVTVANTLTASSGFTVTTGAVNITGTSGALALSGLSASSINTGANALTITSSNFNTTATGINNTAIGATTASSGAFTSLSANTTISLQGNAAATLTTSSGNLTLDATSASTPTVGLGSGAQAKTIQIGSTSGAVAQTINIGNNGTASSSTAVVIGSTIAGTTTLQSAGGVVVSTLSGTTGATVVCRNASNILSTCTSTYATNLQSAYDNDVDGSDSIITLSTADDGIIIRNPAASGSDSTYNLTIDQLATGANGGLSIQSAGTGNLLLITDTTATARDVLTIADGGATTFRNQTDSTTAFNIVRSGGTSLLKVDTTNSYIYLGSNSVYDAVNDKFTLGSSTPDTAKLNITTGSVGLKINETSTNYLLQLQKNATDVVQIAHDGSTLFKNSTDNTTAFRLQNSAGNNYILLNTSGASLSLGDAGIASTVQIGNTTGAVTQTINIGNNATASSTSNITIGSTIAGTTTLQSQGGVVVSTLGTNDTATYLCRNSANKIATCATTGAGAAFFQGGNSFGATATLGSNDSNSLAFETNNATQATIAVGGATTFQNSSDSSSGFKVAKAAGDTIFSVDTSNEYVINNGVKFSGDNILQNPSFEAGPTGNIGTTDETGWGSGSSFSIVNNSANAHSGNRYLTYTANTSTVSAAASTAMAVQPGDVVYAEAWNKTSGSANGSGGIFLEFLDKDYANATYDVTGFSGTPGTSYSLRSIKATVPAGKVFVRLYMTVRNDATTGVYYFDDAYLGKVTNQSPQLYQNSVDSTTAFQIQNAAGTSNLFVADTTNTRIGIGGPAANSLLTIGTNTTAATGGITFGTDTNIYRSAADTLKTDDSIIVGANATFNGEVFSPSASGISVSTNSVQWVELNRRFKGIANLSAPDRLEIEVTGGDYWGDGTTIFYVEFRNGLVVKKQDFNGGADTGFYTLKIYGEDALATSSATKYRIGLSVGSGTSFYSINVKAREFLGTATNGEWVDVVNTTEPSVGYTNETPTINYGNFATGAGTFTTNSATGLKVQTTASVNVLTADASSNKLLIGSGAATTAAGEAVTLKTGNSYGFLQTNGTVSVGSYVDASIGYYGTYTNHALQLFTNNQAGSLILGTNGSTTLKNNTNSASAFVIQSATAADTLLSVDTTTRSASGGNLIKVGNSTGTDTNTTILQLDAATAVPTTNLAALNGGLFYNSTTNKISIIENGTVKVVCNTTDAGCGAGSTTTLQNAYDNDADGSDSIITLSTADDGIIIRNPSSSGSDSTYNLVLDQLSTGAKGGLSIQSAGTGNLLLVTDTTATARDVLTIADKGWTTFRNQTNGSTAFRIQDSSGADAFIVDTSNTRVSIGDYQSSDTLTVGPNSEAANIGLYSYEGTGANSYEAIDFGDRTSGNDKFTLIRYGDTYTGAAYLQNAFVIKRQRDKSETVINQQALLIDDNGNTGIGTITAAPTALLQVSGASGGGANTALFKVTDTTATAADVLTIADKGWTTFRNQTDDTTSFEIQNAAGTSNLFVADTTNSRIGIQTASPDRMLTIAPPSNAAATLGLKSTGGAGGSIEFSANGTYGAAIGYNKNADGMLEFTTGGIGFYTGDTVFSLSSTGQATFTNGTNSTTAFQVQNASGTSLLNADTTNLDLTVGGNLLVSKASQTNQQWSKVSSTAGTIGGNNSNLDGVHSSVMYNGALYVGTEESNAAEIYRYDGSNTWTKVSGTAGTVGGGTAGIDGIEALVVYNGSLYAGTYESGSVGTGQAEVYRYDGGSTWTKVSGTTGTIGGGATTAIDKVMRLVVFNGSLYAGTSELNKAEVYRYDGGSTWTKVSNATAGNIGTATASIDTVGSLTVYNNQLYAGTAENDKAEVYRYDGGTTWTLVNSTAGTFNTTTLLNSVYSMTVNNGLLYIGTDDTDKAEVYRYDGGTTWTKVSQTTAGTIAASGTATIDGIGSIVSYNNQLYIGTYTTNDQAEVYRYDGGTTWTKVSQTTAGTIAASGTGSINEIGILQVAYGSIYAGTLEANSTEIYRYSDNIIEGRTSDTAGVFSLGTTGTVNFQNSTNSTTAYNIQNTAGDNLFTVDSTNAGNITLLGNNGASLGSWTQNSNSLTGSTSNAGTAYYNGYVYIVGGNTSTTVQYAKVNANGSIGTFANLTSTPLPAARNDVMVVASNGYLYAIGGFQAATAQTTSYFAKIKTDGTIGPWNSTTALTTGRYASGIVAYNGFIYIIGGSSTATAVGDTYYAKQSGDGNLGPWTLSGNVFPSAQVRRGLNVAIANGYLYAVGGQSGSSSQDDIYYSRVASDGSIGSWTADSDLLPANRAWGGMQVVNGYLYYYGGWDGAAATSSVYYTTLNADGSTNSWSTNSTTLPATRSDFMSFNQNGYLYLLGGGSANVYYVSTPRVTIGGGLDLVGLSGENMSEGGSGGTLTAGNTNIVGTLNVQDQANFLSDINASGKVSIKGGLTVNGSLNSTALDTETTNSTGPDKVQVVGKYAYVLSYDSNFIMSYDISDPQNITYINHVSTGTATNPEDMVIQGKYAYVANSNSGSGNSLGVFDISNPNSMTLLSTISSGSTGSTPNRVLVAGQYAYVFNTGGTSIAVIDVSQPTAPSLKSTFTTSGATPRGGYIQGKYMYVAERTGNKMEIIDISNPSSLSSVGTVAITGAADVAINGKYAYVSTISGSGLAVVNISNPASPSVIATIAQDANMERLQLQGNTLYGISRNGGSSKLEAYDVSAPAAPVLVETISTGSDPYEFQVVGKYAYVANYTSGTFQIFDVGGAYIQQLEAGGLRVTALAAQDVNVNNNANIQGSLAVGGNVMFQGALSIGGDITPGVNPTSSTGSVVQTAVTSANNRGIGSSIGIGGDGYPVISNYDNTTFDLIVTHCTNTTCSTNESNTAADDTVSGNVGAYSALAIGTDGYAVIAHYDANTGSGRLLVTKCGDYQCTEANATTTSVDDNDNTNANGATADNIGNDMKGIAIGTDGYPVLSYYDQTNGDLRFTKCGNAACSSGNTTTNIDSTGNVGQNSSVAIGSDGNPIVAYSDVTNSNLKAIKCGNPACSSGNTTTTVDSTTSANTGGYPSVAIGSDGFPAIAYSDGTNSALEFVKCTNASCSSSSTPVQINNAGADGEYNSLKMGTDGLPIISYYTSGGAGDLKVAKCGNSGCTAGNTLTTLETSNDVGSYSSLTFGTDDLPIISHYSVTATDLRIYHCGNSSCSGTGQTYSGGINIGSSSKYFNEIYARQYYGKNFSISNFDLAEEYSVEDQTLEAGEIVALNPESGKLKRAGLEDREHLFGIISTNPGLALRDYEADRTDTRLVALVGRVPLKVKGPIATGDPITISSKAGYGVKATTAGMIVGRALETVGGDSTIMVYVQTQYFVPTYEQDAINFCQFQNLSVPGEARIATLVVSGDATFNGRLIVAGHFVTAGDAPEAKVSDAAVLGGNTEKPVVTVAGNDTSGTITIDTAGLTQNVQAGDLVDVAFAKQYDKIPKVFIEASNEDATTLIMFRDVTTDKFIMKTKTDLLPDKKYKFDYFVVE